MYRHHVNGLRHWPYRLLVKYAPLVATPDERLLAKAVVRANLPCFSDPIELGEYLDEDEILLVLLGKFEQ